MSTTQTQSFYDRYWPQNVPDWQKTREHVRSLLPDGHIEAALDGGCGTGVCSLALAERALTVTAVDISAGSLATARRLARETGRCNIRFCQGSLLDLPLPSESFDLVFSWGVIHHTVDPVGALDELVRVQRPGGTLVLAVYLKTWLTPVHEAVRHACMRVPPGARGPILRAFADLVRLAERLGKTTNVRADNGRIESQVEDWYFVPEKHFFSIAEMERLFEQRGLAFELLCPRTGRFRSSSNFIVRGRKY